MADGAIRTGIGRWWRRTSASTAGEQINSSTLLTSVLPPQDVPFERAHSVI
jgi:hypothetical protein